MKALMTIAYEYEYGEAEKAKAKAWLAKEAPESEPTEERLKKTYFMAFVNGKGGKTEKIEFVD